MTSEPVKKVGRNDPCPCGSGKKFKKCHGLTGKQDRSPSAGAEAATYSTLEQHTKKGKLLTPPLARIPNLSMQSWMNDRLPEMLWAATLVGNLPREEALGAFRRVANYIFSLPESEKFSEVTHSSLAQLPRERLATFVKTICPGRAHSEALRPLLLLEDLPASETWREALGEAPNPGDWHLLAHAVTRTLFHQSQESTDCRWARVIALMAAGKLMLPPDGTAKEIGYYPDLGDMRKVRPTIRALELSFSTVQDQASNEWPDLFWAQCLRDTPCFPLNAETTKAPPLVRTTIDQVGEVRRQLQIHCASTRKTTAVDERHDAVFGFALYSLEIVEELLMVGNCHTVIGRTALRAVVECYIALAYLVKKDDPRLWKLYRVFGAGQAKLAFLKLSKSEDRPMSIDVDTLEALANEDVWQEFVQIKVGDWESADLRKRSEEAGVKDVYDRFYSWTSAYAHGHWCAIRDAVFDTCSNPLHRLHRIPRDVPRALPDVIPDACEVVDKILSLLSQAYPTFDTRISAKA